MFINVVYGLTLGFTVGAGVTLSLILIGIIVFLERK